MKCPACGYIVFDSDEDEALAQIAEMEREQNSLLSEKASEKPCMTWNDRINQMTVEEKAEFISKPVCEWLCPNFEDENCTEPMESCRKKMVAFFNSPYTEGDTDEG